LGYDDGLLVIEMTAVTAPYVLDFAGAYLDRAPDYPEGILAEWETEKQEQFADRWPEVQRILWTLEGFGIFVADISPSNICLDAGDRFARFAARPRAGQRQHIAGLGIAGQTFFGIAFDGHVAEEQRRVDLAAEFADRATFADGHDHVEVAFVRALAGAENGPVMGPGKRRDGRPQFAKAGWAEFRPARVAPHRSPRSNC